MKNTKDKIALLESDLLEEMIDELSYLRLLIDDDVKPTAKSLAFINENLKTTIDSFDTALAAKASEVLTQIDLVEIQNQIVQYVVEHIENELKDIKNLSELSTSTIKLVDKFQVSFHKTEQILDSYDRRINSTKMLSLFISTGVVVAAFVLGTMFNPFLLYFFTEFLS